MNNNRDRNQFTGNSRDRNQAMGHNKDRNRHEFKDGDNNNNNSNSNNQQQSRRRTVDYFTPLGKYMISKNIYNRRRRRQPIGKIRPDASYLTQLLPPTVEQASIVDTAAKFVHVSTNKSKHAIHVIKWTPDARRVLVASYSGEFTVWNGLTFNFESIMQAHDAPIYAMDYSHNGEWLISGDQMGTIKFWQPNFNNVNILNKAHEQAIQDLVFSPNDTKFVSCSDDQFLKVWNFGQGREERTLKSHHWDVKSCDWHPSLGLIVSGSKDNLVKFWDPRDAKCISTLHDFKHTVTKTKFQKKGNERLLAACSRDHSTRIFDLRTMKTLSVIKSEDDVDLTSVTWHPIHSSTLTIGGYDGSLASYDLMKSIDQKLIINTPSTSTSTSTPFQSNSSNITTIIDQPLHRIPYAHERAIYTLEYHPLGHMLCTAGADKSMRFWSRARPNDSSFNDSAYTGESWNDKQQALAIKDLEENKASGGAGDGSNDGGSAGTMGGGAGGAGGAGEGGIPGLSSGIPGLSGF